MVPAAEGKRWSFFGVLLASCAVSSTAIPASYSNATSNNGTLVSDLSRAFNTTITAFSVFDVATVVHDPLQIIDIDQPEDILNFKYVLKSPQNNTVFRLPDNSIISKHTEVEVDESVDSGNSLEDAEEVESFVWPFTNDKTYFWAQHQLVDTETYQELEPVPISQCLDTTEGQTGSISVTHSTVVGINDKAEFGAKLSLGIGFKVVLASALSLSQEYLYSATASVPQGVSGQLFIIKPTIDKSLMSTVVYKVKLKLKKVREFKTTVSTLSPNNPFEYMFITSDKAPLKCLGLD